MAFAIVSERVPTATAMIILLDEDVLESLVRLGIRARTREVVRVLDAPARTRLDLVDAGVVDARGAELRREDWDRILFAQRVDDLLRALDVADSP
jgi:hypothetical protein